MKYSLLLICLFICISSNSQDYDFGKVSKEEIEERFNPLDSSASATYLFKDRDTHFQYMGGDGFQLVTEIHERIKIYNKEGYVYATKTISSYHNGSSGENISGLKGYTYNLEKGKIKETKLSKSSIFETEKSEYFNETKFTMPNIKPGSVVEFKYKVTSPFISNVDEFVFQHDIPIKKLEARFEAPEYFVYKSNMKGFLSVIPVTESETGVIRFVDKSRNVGSGYSGSATTTFSSSEITYYKQISKYNLENIPALRDEPYVNSINNYRSSVKYELSYTKYPNSLAEYYSTTWEDVVKKIYESSSFGEELNKTGYFKDDIDALISSVSDPTERTLLIFDFVKSRVKWNNYYGYYTNDGVRKAYNNQVGNVAEINLMLTSMLQYAGLNANPVLVSTRTHGVPLFATREGYNYVVTCVKFSDGTVVLLDATDKYSVPDILPFRALNWQGRIVAENGYSELIDLYPKTKSKNSVIMMVKINEEGTLEGNYRSVKTSHRALSFRNSYSAADEDDYLEELENRYGGIEVSDYEVKNDEDLSKPIQESYKLIKENQADIIGDKMYFSPLFYLKTSKNPFKLEKREFPIDFGYPSITSQRVIINIPEGYKIESVPESAVIALPDNLGSFSYKVMANGESIHASLTSQINQSIISPTYYQALKEYFNTFIQKEAEQVVLTKI